MDIEKKIRKLLALSESPNEFEAQAALLKARQLMAEYKLTEAELHEGNKKVKTIKTSISCTKQTNFWIFTLCLRLKYAASFSYSVMENQGKSLFNSLIALPPVHYDTIG